MSHAIKKAKSLLARNEAVERAKSLLTRKETVEWTKSLLVRKKKAEPAKPLLIQQQSVEQPHESKLMICTEVLCTLVSAGPLTLTRLCDKFEMSTSRLEPHLRLLWNRGLVEEQNLGADDAHYVVTQRGLNVLKVIGPLVKEAHKIRMHDFEVVSNALSGAGIP
ncbi:MAG: hypothetical protein CW691_06230 [Candidatus Bathyarchaeum sp.]|nr:MAG: hypothetical protein CW691_06230 [Candidatus Bathyarchaeum sp.]